MSMISRIIGVGVIAVITGMFVIKPLTRIPTTPAQNYSEVASQAYRADTDALNRIQSTVDSSRLAISVSVVDLQTGQQYQFGSNDPFTAASIGKLVTAAAYLRMVETGQADLNDNIAGQSARTQLEKMIVKSDNPSWHNIREAVTAKRQQAYAKSIGLESYNASNNTMTSSDVALLLSKLASGHLLNTEYTQLLLSYMKEANYRGYIVDAAPSNAAVYHKVGLLEDRLHDAAIIKEGDRSFVLVVFSKSAGIYSFSEGVALFDSITKAASEAFFGQQ